MKDLDLLRKQLAEFFCEDPESFKMEECFKIFHNFSEKFRLAVKENEKRRIQEEQACVRRKLREEQLRKRQCNDTCLPILMIVF
jgi:inverted formin-2